MGAGVTLHRLIAELRTSSGQSGPLAKAYLRGTEQMEAEYD